MYVTFDLVLMPSPSSPHSPSARRPRAPSNREDVTTYMLCLSAYLDPVPTLVLTLTLARPNTGTRALLWDLLLVFQSTSLDLCLHDLTVCLCAMQNRT